MSLDRREFLKHTAGWLALGSAAAPGCAAATANTVPGAGPVHVDSFLPQAPVRDASVSYMPQIQAAMDEAARRRQPLVFTPGAYLIDDPRGLQIRSFLTMSMAGAVFWVRPNVPADGAAFSGTDVTDVTLTGGEIAGVRDQWPDSVNIAGVRLYGHAARITIEDLYAHDLSSNAIGVLGSADNPQASQVTIARLRTNRCCSKYNDYLEPNAGPVPGASRQDQGDIAMYYVSGFSVSDCTLENSRSDETHFFGCTDGVIQRTTIRGAKMGGYFLESCTRVDGRGNTIEGCGSRGATIEANSLDCSFTDNQVRRSGRDGLWVVDAVNCTISGNVFEDNGLKLDQYSSCNLNITDTAWPSTPSTPRCRNVQVTGNVFILSGVRYASVLVGAAAIGVVISKNTMQGAMRSIDPDGWLNGVGRVVVEQNTGWKTEASGSVTIDADGALSVFKFPHGLDIARSTNPNVLKYVPIVTEVSAPATANAPAFTSSADVQNITVRFQTPPAAGALLLSWSAARKYAT